MLTILLSSLTQHGHTTPSRRALIREVEDCAERIEKKCEDIIHIYGTYSTSSSSSNLGIPPEEMEALSEETSRLQVYYRNLRGKFFARIFNRKKLNGLQQFFIFIEQFSSKVNIDHKFMDIAPPVSFDVDRDYPRSDIYSRQTHLKTNIFNRTEFIDDSFVDDNGAIMISILAKMNEDNQVNQTIHRRIGRVANNIEYLGENILHGIKVADQNQQRIYHNQLYLSLLETYEKIKITANKLE
ncbi:MAG: hypothetical protein AAF944_03600 [Bacteroidota bacterium]